MTDFKKLYDEWWFTVEGAGGDLDEWKTGLQDILDEQGIGKIKEWATFKGSEMNQAFGLTGNNAYPDDLTFLAFSLDGLDQDKLPMFKMRFGARWFTDIVDNNARRENNPIYPWNTSGAPEEETQVEASTTLVGTRNQQDSLNRVADRLLRCYNGPQYRGARIPKAEPGCINAINLPDNCRLKWLQAEAVDGQLEVEYTTQEPFKAKEGEQVVDEIANALEYITQCDVEIGADTEEGDVPVVVEVICRDGRDYGYVIMDMVIKDFQ